MMTTEHGRQSSRANPGWNRVADAWEKWDRLFEEQTGTSIFGWSAMRASAPVMSFLILVQGRGIG
ncbi:MAG TPA: hypothetical protein VJR69_02715 [Nitrospira sp.]|nr:hypothetical protein [Nitrospira sp.]